MKKTCETCNKEFDALVQKGYNTRWCSKKCRYDYLIFSVVGKKFNSLYVISEAEPKVLKMESGTEIIKMVNCKCDCGNSCVMSATRIKIGKTKSCGCLRDSSYKVNCDQTIHGLFKHPLNHIWAAIRQRCNNPENPAYPDYGARGVRMCDEWNDFMAFYNWCMSNGWRSGLEVDKDIKAKELGIEGLLYSPEMCMIVTRRRNTNTRRTTVYVELDGKQVPFQLACDKLGLKSERIYQRMRKNGYDFKKAIENEKQRN